MKGEYEAALKLHKAHLSLVQELGDYAAQGRAYGNMGNAYHALGIYDQAVRYHRQELQISLEVNPFARHSCWKTLNWEMSEICVLAGERPTVTGLHSR